MTARSPAQTVVINGAHGEGGGALLRTALAMSALTQLPLRVHGVRGAMRRQGLNSEDLTFLQALAESCQAAVSGDELESKELTFAPSRPPQRLDHQFDVSAHEQGAVSGSAPVIVESLTPVLCRAGAYSRLSILGETHGQNTLGFDALEHVVTSVHRSQGVCVFPSLAWAGFGSASKGELLLEVEPSVPTALEWSDRGRLLELRATVSLGELSEDIGERGAKRLRQVFSERGHEIEVDVQVLRSRGPGASVTVWAQFERGAGSGTALGQRGLRIEAVADNAVRSFDEWFQSDATLDSFLADQVLLIAALAEGRTVYSTPRVTRRLVTMSWVIKQFLPIHITVKGEEGYPGTVTVAR
ncbi:MAG: RNA 3'-terminal phosphate cyclase [Armatimonadetes bacterium]|nr:RNA 3'-terminal phosphate cyclase [Armatimonadota bacterium]